MMRLLWLLALSAAALVLCTIITRSPIEPLVGLLIFWASLLLPALWQRARQKLSQISRPPA